MEAQVQGAQGSLFAGDGGGASFTQPPNLKALPEKASQLGFDFDFIFVFQAGSGSGNNGINVCKGSGVCFFFFFFSFGAVSPHLRGWIPTSTSGLWRSRLERMGVGGGRRSGRRELRGGARRKEGLLLAPGSLHWLCRPPTSAPAPVGSPGASSRKPSLTSQAASGTSPGLPIPTLPTLGHYYLVFRSFPKSPNPSSGTGASRRSG